MTSSNPKRDASYLSVRRYDVEQSWVALNLIKDGQTLANLASVVWHLNVFAQKEKPATMEIWSTIGRDKRNKILAQTINLSQRLDYFKSSSTGSLNGSGSQKGKRRGRSGHGLNTYWSSSGLRPKTEDTDSSGTLLYCCMSGTLMAWGLVSFSKLIGILLLCCQQRWFIFEL
jgi:hypothetical protein